MKRNAQFALQAMNMAKGMPAMIPPRKDSDVRPGDRMGLDVEQVQQYIKRQQKAKGGSQLLTLGDNNTIQIKLPGTARVMLGFSLNFNLPGGVTQNGLATLQLDNEIMIEDVPVTFFGANYTDEEYYFFPRPLSGNDELKLFIKGVSAVYTMENVFYYL